MPKNSILKLSLGCSLFVVGVMLGAIFLVGAPEADAAVYTLSGSCTPAATSTCVWNNPAIWSPNTGGYPGSAAGDTAALNSGLGVTVTTVVPNGVILSYNFSGNMVHVAAGSLQIEASSTFGSGGNTIDVNGGALTLNSGGGFSLPSGNTLQMSSGTTTNLGVFNVFGTVTVTGGTYTGTGGQTNVATGGVFNLNGGTLTTPNMSLNGGAAPPGTLNWGGGTINGTGFLQVGGGTPKAIVNLTGANGVMTLNKVQLLNVGTVNFSSPVNSLDLVNGGNISSGGLGSFLLQADAAIISSDATGYFSNGATLQKTAGTTSPINVQFENTGTVTFGPTGLGISFNRGGTHTGTFSMPTGNSLSFNGLQTFNPGSNFTGSGPNTVTIVGGTFQENTDLTIPANVSNSATLQFSGGITGTHTLNITGNYAQTGSGTLNVKLNGSTPGTQYDQIIATGTATLNGTLNATLGFVASVGQTFDIIKDTTTAGDFAATNFTNCCGVVLQEIPKPPTGQPQVRLQAVAPPLSADMAILKTGPASVNNGQNATYTVKVGNGGPDPATNVVVTDTFSGGTFVSATATGGGTCSGISSPFTCSWASIANGVSQFITVVLKANGSPGPMNNTASVTANEPDPGPGVNSSSVSTTVNPSADLGVGASPSVVSPNAASPESWTVTVTNVGPDAASGVSVNVSLSAGTLLNASGVGFTCTNTTTTANCTIPSIAASSSASFTVNATTPNQGGSMNLTANVSATTFDPSAANNTTTVGVTVTPVADLQITKTSTSPIVAGGSASYAISIFNAGPSDAATPTVSDAPPAGWTLTSVSGGGCTTLPCTLADVIASTTVTINATFSVPSNASGSVTNAASVSSPTFDPATPNTASVAGTVVQKADLSVTKTGTLSGSTMTYNITVTNNGPSDASGVSLSDPPPTGLTFVSATGGCATLTPCNLGTMTSGQTKSITAVYTVGSSAPNPIVNTASVSSATPDPVAANNSASTSTSMAPVCPTAAPANLSPANNATNVSTSTTLSWSNVGAGSYKVFFGKAGTGCQTLIANVGQTSLAVGGLDPGTVYEWRVEATSNGCTTFTSSCQRFTTFSACPATPPTLISPAGGTVSGTTTFSWSSVPGAVDYKLFVNNNLATTTTATSFGPVSISTGPVSWYVVAEFNGGCGPLQSQTATFNGCNIADAPLPSIVANAVSGQGYDFKFTIPLGTTQSEVQESTDPGFGMGTTNTQTTMSNTVRFQHTINTPTAFYYRVRAFLPCANGFTAYSVIVRVVLAPFVAPTNPNITVPAGNSGLVEIPVHINGFPGQSLPFTATLDNKPWLRSVRPASGVLPPEGLDFIVTADITGLPNGTFTGTVILLVTTSAIGGNIHEQGVTPVSAPVSVSLVTAVTPQRSGTPPATAVIIPSVGHLDGISSHWQSDVRVANTSQQSVKYQLTFTPDDIAKGVKQTIIDVNAGVTTALDDIIKTWYGVGSLGETANGVLEIRPVDSPGKGAPENDDVSVSLATIASSRAYNVTAQGTLGQFIPALPFSGFIGRALDNAHAATVLGLQQIAQNNDFRTNLGIVEASGQPVSVLVSAFDSSGTRLLDFPLDLKGNEQRQLNSFLAQNKISLSDGRFEVKVTSGEGKITTYASVIDNKSGDPLLVSGVPLGQNAFDHFVLPGVADLNTGFAAWRTDMRLFNPTTSPQFVTLSFYAQNSTAAPQMTSMTINPGEVKKLDNMLSSAFGLTNVGGAVHVTTNAATPLVISGRTFNQTSAGTFGQFIPAVTAADAVGKSDRALQILQAEDSVRYRTNVGIAEVTGKPATVEVQVILPDSKIAPTTQIPIPANGFIQLPLIQSFGLSNVYNARISLRVVDGDGKISAYGSVIDQITQDPTFIPAQK
ncbi:MAG: hypothetical protein M3041_09095 [Acidobacteriota bacterium]|nr:hypothetical protein [Acidobacteriota bacterium]